MPSIAAGNGSPPLAAAAELKRTKSVKVHKSGEIRSTPGKRRLRSNSAAEDDGGPIASTPSPKICSPTKWKSPRRCIRGSPNSPASGIAKGSGDKLGKLGESLVKKLSEAFIEKPEWNPRDVEQLSVVKDTLHVSKAPCTLVCREDEQERVLQFCKQCIEQEKAGSLYVCGCPGTGKSLSMERVKESLIKWVKEAGFQQPDVLTVNCTSLTYSSEIFSKILGKNQPRKKTTSPLQNLQHLYSQKQQSAGMKMMLIIADELDYLITKDRAVLHDLFMLTTFPSSRCILIGIANAIDLADRFLPRLQSLNCKPLVVTFRAYSKDQIILILQQRLKAFPFKVFQPQALELCARKVAAACGDMRKALSVCRSAIEMLEAELRESACILDLPSADIGFLDQRSPACDLMKQNSSIVRVDHMAIALSKTYRSPTVDTIQALPQHQQIILCSAVKLFCGGKKDATVGELCKSYLDICKLILIPPVGNTELSSMCRVLADQGLLKLGQSREDKLRRVTLNVDDRDIAFALEGIRVFRNCLNAGNKNMDL